MAYITISSHEPYLGPKKTLFAMFPNVDGNISFSREQLPKQLFRVRIPSGKVTLLIPELLKAPAPTEAGYVKNLYSSKYVMFVPLNTVPKVFVPWELCFPTTTILLRSMNSSISQE